MNFDKLPTVPWYGLSWKQIEEKGLMSQVEVHLAELNVTHGKDKAAEYLKYLKNGPQNFPSKYQTEGRKP